MALVSFNRISVPNANHKASSDFIPYETVQVHKSLAKNSSWTMCYQTIWTMNKDYTDTWFFLYQDEEWPFLQVLNESLLVLPFQEKILWICDMVHSLQS